MAELPSMEFEDGIIKFFERSQALARDVDNDSASILRVGGTLHEARGLESVDQTRDIRDADDEFGLDLCAALAVRAMASEDAQQVVGGGTEPVLAKEGLEVGFEHGTCSNDVEKDLLLRV
jgi:hypothetical protein